MGEGVERNTQQPAEQLLSLAQQDPHQVIELTHDRPTAERSRDDCVALRARTLAFRILGDNDQALKAITEARAVARELEDTELGAGCLLTSAPLLAQAGDVEGAFAVLDEAEMVGGDLHLAEVEFQRAGLKLLVADWRSAWHHYTDALAVFEANDEQIWQAEALLGRGLMSSYIGNHEDASKDLERSRHLFADAGDTIGVGQAAWNAALVTVMRGDPASAVVAFDEAGSLLTEVGFPIDLFLGDQAEALFAVGLHDEAIELATRCVDAYEVEADQNTGEAKVRNELDAANRRLELAHALLLVGRLGAAEDNARIARARFSDQGQQLRALHARLVLLDVALRRNGGSAEISEQAQTIFADLAGGGQDEWRSKAALINARSLASMGDHDAARVVLARLARRYRSFIQELDRLQLLASLDLQAGSNGAALRRARRAVRFVRSGPQLAGSSYIEAAVSRQIEAVTTIGLAALLRSGRARDAFDFVAEAEASVAVRRVPTETPALLSEYRALTRAIDEASNDLRDASAIRNRRRRVAQQIRIERTGLVEALPGDHSRSRDHEPHVLRWVVADGEVWLLQRLAGRCRARQLASVSAVVSLIEEMTFLLRRELMAATPNVVALNEAALELDVLLGEPGGLCVGDTKVHLAASPLLPPVAFGLLPSLREVEWSRSATFGSAGHTNTAVGDAAIIVGPALTFAQAEAERLAPIIGAAATLAATDATVAAALESFATARVVHVAAHSTLNTTNPMFSSIRMADGPLYLHELETLQRVPEVVVLASCESAREEQVGTTGVGLATGLLYAGIQHVIGTALEIPDCEETTEVMCSLHEVLATMPPAQAVAHVRSNAGLTARAQLIAASLVPCSNH